jgi:2'-5' RNA ligase
MRAFLAVAIPAGLREQTAGVQKQIKELLAGSGQRIRVTWVKPDAIHLTIKFLGEFDTNNVDALRDRVGAVVDGLSAIDIPLATVGAFPRSEAPRALWIGPPHGWAQGGEAKAALELAARIDAICATFAVPADTHPWWPHLTLARVRAGERQAGRALEISGLMARAHDIGSLRISEISLMKSEMRPEGPVHTPQWTIGVAR